LDDVYKNRICRRSRDGLFEFYSGTKLGAMGSNLAAISWFFDRPYETPSDALALSAKSWVLNQASIGLRAQGRLQEALPAMGAGLRMEEAVQDWRNAAVSASNLSETELLVGEISSAVATAQKSIALANRSGDAYQIIVNCVIHAGALLANGDWGRVARILSDAEQRQQELQPSFRLLYSMAGYLYCDFLLSQCQALVARDRAAQTLLWARGQQFILSVALDALTLGRSHLALTLQGMAKNPLSEEVSVDAHISSARLEEAVERLWAAERNDQVPRGLLARATFRRAVGDWNSAKSDLDEAKEIAEPALMRLYWCDCAHEGARLALAQREAFAPLNGLVEPSPPRPVLPDATAAAALREEARSQLEVARKLIAECGYHRRDEELAELDTVVAGARRFADLPPRV
jgi:tetratricopeptide (TPR) repeat protein